MEVIHRRCAVALLAALSFASVDGLAALLEPSDLQSESSELRAPDCELDRYGITAPVRRDPVVRVDDFGAAGDGVTDDSDAIRAAIASLKRGGTVEFTPGRRYLKRKLVIVDRPDVVLWGYGATVLAVASRDEIAAPKGSVGNAIQLLAPRTAIYGFTLLSNLRSRLVGHPFLNAIYLSGQDQTAIDNRVEYSQGGVFVRMATGFVVARNVVWRTTADAIHMTTGMRDGRVVCNAVRQNGDDMIAIVNYGTGAPNIGNVLIADNDVAGQYWGRGITVAGGRDVTIRGNRIADVTHAAAVLIVSEDKYKTANVDNVLVEGNVIERVQTTRPAWNPISATQRTSHGAIDIGGYGAQTVRRVLVRDNRVRQTARSAVVLRGNACDVRVENNTFAALGAMAIRHEGVEPEGCANRCSGNQRDGREAGSSRCNASRAVEVTGAAETWESRE
jgi:hypothetical protein